MKNIEEIRFTYDDREEFKSVLTKVRNNPKERMKLLSNSLKINKLITPSLYELTEKIEKRLKLKNVEIEYYISRNNELNASCFSLNNGEKLMVILNSGLVNMMTLEELSFVIGHEIGHYIFGHLEWRSKEEISLLTKYNHAMEISADRIGLICTKDIECATKAMVKLISGLDDKFLSNNMTQFIKQHNQLENKDLDIYSHTHPTLPTRTKALKLFSMSTVYYEWKKIEEKAPINKEQLNKTVEKYLDNTSLKFLKLEENHILKMLKVWVLTAIFMEDNILDDDEMYILKKELGRETAHKIKKFIEDKSKKEVYKKLKEMKIKYEVLGNREKKEFVEQIKKIFIIYGNKYQSKKIIDFLIRK